MNRRRILRSWWLWAIVILFAFLILPNLLSGGSDYHGVDTSVAIKQINTNNVKSATQEDKEQVLQLTLKKPYQGNSKISASYPADSGNAIFNDLQRHVANGSFNVKVTKENAWLSILVSLLPILLIVGVLFFVMSQ